MVVREVTVQLATILFNSKDLLVIFIATQYVFCDSKHDFWKKYY